jgi:hypothetical protein
MTFRSLRILLVVALVLSSGCASKGMRPNPALQEQLGAMTFEIAIQVYQAGEYDKAGALFEELAGSSDDPLLQRKARFGLISARLAGAATEQEYDRALVSWREWTSELGGETPVTDPRLLPPVMAALDKRAREAKRPPAKAQPPAKQIPDGALIVEVEEMRRMQQSIQTREEENAMLRERIDALERSAFSSSATAAERLRWSESLKERERENEMLRERIAALESTISTLDGNPRPEELQKVPAEEMMHLVQTVEEKERENLALRERLSGLEQKLSGLEQERSRQAQQPMPPKGGAELSMENQRLREQLEALEQLHQEMIERKRTLSAQ